MTHQIVNGVVFGFTRRRYNNRKTFTWLYWQDKAGMWQNYVADPWPSVRIPKRDLVEIANKIKLEVNGGLPLV